MIIVENDIKIPVPEKEIVEYFSKACSITNPKYTQALSLNLSIFGVTKELKFYDYDAKKNVLSIPVGFLNKVKELYPDEYIIDKRLGVPEVQIKKIAFTGSLRDYQENTVNELKNHDMGIVQAPTGSGKTIMMISHITNFQRPTLVLVNTIELANQFIERLTEFTDLKKEDIGIFGNGKRILRPITVCLLQTLVRANKDVLDFINCQYTQVLCDEVHIVAAHTYYEAMNKLNAKYKFGFSATPERDDGLTRLLHFATGPKIYTVDIKNIKEKLSIPQYRAINTEYHFPLFNTAEYQNMISDMALDEDRNKIILELVKEYSPKQIVILCNRASQVLWLHKNIPGSEYLLSSIPELTDDFKPIYKRGKPVQKSMPKKDRQKVIERLNSGETRIIISTVGLFSTGIDIASLEVLILASPIKSKIKLKQSLGRIMRKTEKLKAPVFIDLVDNKIELLRYQALTRARIIKDAINV